MSAKKVSMDLEQQNEFGRIRKAAYDALRRGAFIERDRSLSLCQYLILPSFDNPISWDVVKGVRNRNEAQTRLYRSRWRMDFDGQALSSPAERINYPRPYKPTFESEWVLIDEKKVEAILVQFNAIRIPLTPANAPIGCDGTSFELAIGHPFCNARIAWWYELPEDWRELQPVVADLENLFLSTWEQGKPQSS
jgi:hypothetical protein